MYINALEVMSSGCSLGFKITGVIAAVFVMGNVLGSTVKPLSIIYEGTVKNK
jgi:hypothetical protein